MRHLRKIIGIRWQDKISNIQVLDMTQSTGLHCWIMRSQLRWVGHVIRLPPFRLPQQILYSELKQGKCTRGAPRKRFEDTLKANLKVCEIDPEHLEEAALDRNLWHRMIKTGVALYEKERKESIERIRELKKSGVINHPAVSNHICVHCGRIGLWSHVHSKHSSQSS